MARTYTSCSCDPLPDGVPNGNHRHYTDAEGIVWHAVLDSRSEMFWNVPISVPQALTDAQNLAATTKAAAIAAKETRLNTLLAKVSDGSIQPDEQIEMTKMLAKTWTANDQADSAKVAASSRIATNIAAFKSLREKGTTLTSAQKDELLDLLLGIDPGEG